MTSKNHYYFMLNLSPWPLISSLSSFNLVLSLLIFFKFSVLSCFLLSIFSVSVGAFFWWCSYSGEFNIEGKTSLLLESGVKFSMLLFISSEVFFFFSFFWSYFHFFLSPSLEIGMSWPPTNVEMFDFSNVPLINTLVLMGSGVTVTMSHFYFMKNDMKKVNFWLFSTISLGVLFSFLQWEEYNSSFFSINDGNFGTSFFVLTGFHGLHVIIGSLFLGLTLYRFSILSSSSKSFLGFELASWYWHFVDVVWIFLYFFIYYLNF